MNHVDIVGTVVGCYAHKCNSDRFSDMDMDMTYDYSKIQMYSLYPPTRRDHVLLFFVVERRNFIGVSLLCGGETKSDTTAFPSDTASLSCTRS